MTNKEIAKEINELLKKAAREGIPVELETPDGQYFPVGVAEGDRDGGIILRN